MFEIGPKTAQNPILQPVTGCDSAVAANKLVALRFEYGNSGGDQPGGTIQLFLTSSQGGPSCSDAVQRDGKRELQSNVKHGRRGGPSRQASARGSGVGVIRTVVVFVLS
jgi:hypothetical protein